MPGPSGPYYAPTGELIVPQSTLVEIGDVVSGPGIPLGTTVTNITLVSGPMGNYLSITLSAIPWTGSSAPPGVSTAPQTSGLTGLTSMFSSSITFSRMEFVQVPDPINNLLSKTLSFKEDIKGWVSFKSFIPENAISMANDYYTFVNANLYKHHIETVDRNTFYEGDVDFPFTASSFNVILNNAPGSIKSFSTLNYEGSQTKVDIPYDDSGAMVNDGEYFNLIAKKGWYVEAIETDLEKGSLNEFINKEGKWFNYLKGQNVVTNVNNQIVVNTDGSSSFDQASFAIQGIGTASSIAVVGCMDPIALNYNPLAEQDPMDSCEYSDTQLVGCTDPLATNYNSLATIDDGSCTYIGAPIPGCTDMTANNYNPLADTDDGSCTYTISGCTDPSMFNYNPLATLDDGSCVPVVLGCTNQFAPNYNPLANTDDGSCTTVVSVPSWNCNPGGGCFDPGDGNGQYTTLSACQANCEYTQPCTTGTVTASAVMGDGIYPNINPSQTPLFSNNNHAIVLGTQANSLSIGCEITNQYLPPGTTVIDILSVNAGVILSNAFVNAPSPLSQTVNYGTQFQADYLELDFECGSC